MVKSAVPEHALSAALGELSADAGYTGVTVGCDDERNPVQVLMFRPTPTQVTFAGDLRTARILVLRCLAFGVRVIIKAAGGLGDAPQWTMLDHAAAGSGRRVWQEDRLSTQGSPGTHMILNVFDAGTMVPPPRQTLGPWQTQLTVLSQVTQNAVTTLVSSDFVLAQRLSPHEATLTATALGHGEQVAAGLARMPDGMIAVLTRGDYRWTWLMPTSVEQRLFG